MPLGITKDPEFNFGEVVFHKITGFKGIVLSVTYESSDFCFYTVNYGNEIDRVKEYELMGEEDYRDYQREQRILNGDDED